MKTLFQCFKRSGLVLSVLFAVMLFAKQSHGQGTQTFSTAGTFTNGFTVPAGVSNITVQVWGAGGGAGGGGTNSRGGGGGGAFATTTNIAVTPGQQFTIVVGAGGTPPASGGNGADGTAGGSSSFGTSVVAAGGSPGQSGGTGGAGGVATSPSVGATIRAGGNGGNNSSGNGGGGGGQAGCSSAAGNNGGNATGTPGGIGGGQTGNIGTCASVGAGGSGGATGAAGNSGVAPGGGGGSKGNGSGVASGAGASGRVTITWTCPTATISYPSSLFCKAVTTAQATINGVGSGTFSSTAGLTINSSTGEINPSTSTSGTYTVHYQFAGGGGCSAIDATATVTINGTPVTSVTGQSDVNCFAGSDGSITIAATGGTAPYFYSVNNGTTWTASASPSPFVYGGLSANTQYRIRVKDSNGCLSK